MTRQNGINKIRVDISMTTHTKANLDSVVAAELEEDRSRDRPERSQSEILEMVLMKGYRAWKQEHAS